MASTFVVLKALARMFACVPFLRCLFGAIFKLRQAMDDQKNMTNLVFNVLLFLEVVLSLDVHLLYRSFFPSDVSAVRHFF